MMLPAPMLQSLALQLGTVFGLIVGDAAQAKLRLCLMKLSGWVADPKCWMLDADRRQFLVRGCGLFLLSCWHGEGAWSR